MGANHDTIKEELEKLFKLKNKVAGSLRCLHNRGMIKNLFNNYRVQFAFAIYQAFCTGLVTTLLGLKLVDLLFGRI